MIEIWLAVAVAVPRSPRPTPEHTPDHFAISEMIESNMLINLADMKFRTTTLWQYGNYPTMLSLHETGFHILYRLGGDTRVCSNISDSMDLQSWEIDFPWSNLCTQKSITRAGRVPETIYKHKVLSLILFTD